MSVSKLTLAVAPTVQSTAGVKTALNVFSRRAGDLVNQKPHGLRRGRAVNWRDQDI
jgi:hypothetical protein